MNQTHQYPLFGLQQLIDDGLRIRAIGGEGILTPNDLKSFDQAEQRIFDLMKDCGWHSATDIIAASQQREGLRRMRSLKTKIAAKGLTIARQRPIRTSREFFYRIQQIPAES
jgi:hypothetical protein